MKKVLFKILAFVSFIGITTGQTTQKEWEEMMNVYKESVNKILMNECPKDLKLSEFKEAIIEGKLKLSKDAESKILKQAEKIKTYGKEVVKRFNVDEFTDDELIMYGSFSPLLNPENSFLEETHGGPELSIAEIWSCLVRAGTLGLAEYFGAEGLLDKIKKKGIKGFLRIAAKFLSRFAGPIGVALTIIDLGACLYEEWQD